MIECNNLKLVKEKQLEIRMSNQEIKKSYCHKNNEKDDRRARNLQFYEDGNDNAFNWIISKLEK